MQDEDRYYPKRGLASPYPQIGIRDAQHEREWTQYYVQRQRALNPDQYQRAVRIREAKRLMDQRNDLGNFYKNPEIYRDVSQILERGQEVDRHSLAFLESYIKPATGLERIDSAMLRLRTQERVRSEAANKAFPDFESLNRYETTLNRSGANFVSPEGPKQASSTMRQYSQNFIPSLVDTQAFAPNSNYPMTLVYQQQRRALQQLKSLSMRTDMELFYGTDLLEEEQHT